VGEEKLAKGIVKEQGRVKQVEAENRGTEARRFFKGCLGFVVGVPIAVTMCVMAITDGDGEGYLDPNDDPANVAAKEDLKQSFSWVKDLYVSPRHMNIGVVPGEKEWGAPMIARAVCSTLKSHRSTVRRVRFVDVYETSAGKSPRQAEIVVVQCPEVEPIDTGGVGDDEEPRQSHSTSASIPAVEVPRDTGQNVELSVTTEYELISTDSNNLVENFYLWFKGSDLSESSLKQFAAAFTARKCTKPCNLNIYDKKLDEALVTKYPLRGAEYIEVADHLAANQVFDEPGEVGMWPFKNDSAYEEAKKVVIATE
jgi:hypothetical protein